MRKSLRIKETQVVKGINNGTTSKAVRLHRREPLTDKTNVTNDTSATKKNSLKTETIEDTSRNMKTRKAKQATTTAVRTRTRSQATPVTSPKKKPITRKAAVSTKVRTRKSLDKVEHDQEKKLSDSVIKHMKSVRVTLTRNAKGKKQTNKSIEISDDSSKIRQSARISIRKNKQNSDTVVENKDPTSANTFRKPFIKSPVKGRSNPLEVYEFEYDPKEDPRPKLKRKREQVKRYSSDSSGEENNSMKTVVKRLRKLDRKLKQNPVEKEREKQPIATKKTKKTATVKNSKQKQTEVEIQEMFEEIRSKQNQVKQNIVVVPPVVVENVDEPCVIVPEVHVEERNKEKSTRNVIEEVANSFLEDDSPDFYELQPISPGPINIISNVLIRRSNENIAKPVITEKQEIFNSTMMNATAGGSSPWRLNISTIRKKPHAFTVKDKSFIPCYDQDIIEISSRTTVLNETNNTSAETVQNENKMKNKETDKVVNQTSILEFIKSSKPRTVENKPVGLFDDVPAKKVASPRRVLGEINYLQSTPFKPTNSIRSCNSPNISVISPKRSGTEDSMFGFSFLSDSDNITYGNKENAPTRRSPKKQKDKDNAMKNVPTRISINEIKRTLAKDVPKLVTDNDANAEAENVIENPKTVHFEEPEMQELDETDVSVALFEDPEDSVRVSRVIYLYIYFKQILQ